jgi:hypothetical protein
MNRESNPSRKYKTASPLLRCAFAVAALTITLGVGVAIDTLAWQLGPAGTLAAAPAAAAANARA